MHFKTMEQQMFYHLPTTSAHKIPSNRSNTPLNKIITSKNHLLDTFPNKETDHLRGHSTPNALPRKRVFRYTTNLYLYISKK